MNASDLIVGRVMGFAAVAFVSRAQGVMNVMHRDLLGAVRGVMIPAFAKAHREGQNVAEYYARSVSILSVIAWPFYGFMALFPLEVVRLLFGPQWDATAPLVPIFCLAGAFAALWTLAPSVILAAGQIDLMTRAEFLIQPSANRVACSNSNSLLSSRSVRGGLCPNLLRMHLGVRFGSRALVAIGSLTL